MYLLLGVSDHDLETPYEGILTRNSISRIRWIVAALDLRSASHYHVFYLFEFLLQIKLQLVEVNDS